MNNIFVREHSSQQIPSDGPRLLSFVSGKADFYPEDFLSQKEVEDVYLRVFTPLMERLYDPAATGEFEYRGVALPVCFKKIFFEYAYAAALRFEVLRRAAERLPENFLLQASTNTEVPYLAEIIDATPLASSSRLKIISGGVSPHAAAASQKRWIGFPAMNFGAWQNRPVAVYADPRKSRAVLQRLSAAAFLYLNEPAPRVMARAMWDRLPFYTSLPQAADPQACRSFQTRAETTSVFRDLCLNDIAAENLLQGKMKSLFASRLPSLLAEIDHFHSFFDAATELRSVLVDEDISVAKNAFCQIARERGVSTAVECHGSLGHRSGYLPLTADRIFVWGVPQKEKLIRWGCPQDRITVSGCSRYDFYKVLDPAQTKTTVANRLGFDSKRPLILAAFPPVNRAHARILFENRVRRRIAEIVESIGAVAQERPDAQWILKLHPGDENRAFYESWLAAHPELRKRVKLLQREDPLWLARAADFLIVYWSTYAADGFALEKPVILLYDDTDDSLEEYRSYDVFRYAANTEAMKALCREFLSAPFVPSAGWLEARRHCLNETGVPAAEQTASLLKNPFLVSRSPQPDSESCLPAKKS